ncbi:probable G-protein coupled receptor 158 [Gadus chalcogrammus]|uniref:probable G-protein coupled receptor 158 n=1 Tax=Gadus chalcogrammus TaxID=1042646 RepID=UPI0024C491EE|nr:probable G-protein coupled receptor 158 [Gadus chalcogrammus]
MAVFRFTLLLQVGIVIGLSHTYAEWSARESDVRRRPANNSTGSNPRLAHLSALRSPKDAAERAQKTGGHLPKVVTAFLHTGDSSTLKHANCSRRYELTSLRARSHASPHPSMGSVLDTVVHATNFLNMMLQANRSREQSLRRDIEWYHALVRSVLEGDPKIHRAVVTFNTEPSSAGPSVLLQATRAGGEIVLQDLSATAQQHLKDRTVETEWYHDVKNRKMPNFHKRVLSQDFTSVDNSLKRGESFIPDKTNIKWSAPYLECENGNFVPRWLLTLSAGFYGLKASLAPDFRGVVRVDINLQDVDIDQCSTDGWFAGTHRCNLTTMECLPIGGHGFVLDKYTCLCRRGFYHPNRVAVNGFTREAEAGRPSQREDSSPVGDEAGPSSSSSACMPCAEGCAYCRDDTPCLARDDGPLRLAVLAFQCMCMLLLFASMVLVYRYRRNKGIRASGLILLEAILCGALLLYFPVLILYFQPSVFRCILLRWVRLLGFSTVYGTLTLKLYRVLKVFLSRTAQRVPYMTSWRVLRLLGIIMLVVCWFLVAWTSAVCQHPDPRGALIHVGYTPDRLQFSMCLMDRWDYMMAVAEFLFLLWSVYLCFAVRTVPSAFHEPRYMACAVHNELVLSAIFYIVRFTLASELHPDWMLLLFFTHTHLTVTVTLGLLLVPKFLFTVSHLRDDIASEAYEDEMDMGRSGSYLNSSITSAWSEHSLDPEDIREELKKLYSQLEIYKRKKMLANNPHLQKKRSSKKGLGRSLMRRITEIPESVHRQCSRDDKESGEHGSNRNSICQLRKNPFDPALQPGKTTQVKEEPLKNKVFSLKKSHSSYDHVRDPGEDSNGSAMDKMEVSEAEGSLLDTLMGKKLVRKNSDEKVDAASESTESVPLVCKSASAHNLTADKKPLHPRTSMLQKSLSVIASAKEKTMGLAGKSVEDSSKRSQPKSKDTKTSALDPEDECQPKMINSQSVEYKQTAAKGGIMKQQVSGSQPSICSDPAKSKELYDLSEVCPWEVEDLPTPSENKVQKHVSIAPKETTTHHGAGTKAVKPQQQQKQQKASDLSPSNPRNSKEIPRNTVERADVCPWEEGGGGEVGHSEESKPSGQTRKPGQPAPSPQPQTSRVDVCPWDAEEAQVPDDSAHSQDTSKQRKSTTQADGGKGKSGHLDPSKTDSSLQTSIARADVCPWDSTARADSVNTERPARSPTAPMVTESPLSKKVPAASSRTAERDRARERSKYPDDERIRTKAKEKGKSSLEKHASKPKVVEVCPWEAEVQQSQAVEKLRSVNIGAATVKPAEVCPWDFDEAAGQKDLSDPTARKTSPKPRGKVSGSPKKADVCPWDFEDSTA